MGAHTRKVFGAIIEAIIPPSLLDNPNLVEETIVGVEALIGRYPATTRFGIATAIQVVQWGGPLFLVGVMPFTALSRDARTERVRKLLKHKLWFFRMAVKYLRIVICLTVFSRPEVEERFGARRRDWRENRRTFRDALIQLDEQRSAPPVPNPLGSEPLCSEEDYLDPDRFGQIDGPKSAAHMESDS